MKTSFSSQAFFRLSAALAGAVTLLSFVYAAPPEASQPSSATTSSVSENSKGAAKAAAATVREAISDAWEQSKDATFKQREGVRQRMKTAEAALDARIAEWSVKKDAVVDDAKSDASSAHKEVVEAKAVLSQKIKALDNVTEETWHSVKAELGAAWQRMTSASSNLAAKLQS